MRSSEKPAPVPTRMLLLEFGMDFFVLDVEMLPKA